ncbi:MAG: hypothetical protein ABI791_14710 [Acidobacteriota bacterium]
MKKALTFSTLVVAVSVTMTACGDQAANNSANKAAGNANTAILVNSNAVNNTGTKNTTSANSNANAKMMSEPEHGLPTPPPPSEKGLPTPLGGTNSNRNANTK